MRRCAPDPPHRQISSRHTASADGCAPLVVAELIDHRLLGHPARKALSCGRQGLEPVQHDDGLATCGSFLRHRRARHEEKRRRGKPIADSGTRRAALASEIDCGAVPDADPATSNSLVAIMAITTTVEHTGHGCQG